MTYERFLKVLLSLQKEDRVIKEAYKLGVDMINFVDPYYKIINELIEEIYGEEGYDWFSWYCWENDFGQKDWSKGNAYKQNPDGTSTLIHQDGEPRFGAYDKEGNPICYDHKSLWERMEECKPYQIKPIVK